MKFYVRLICVLSFLYVENISGLHEGTHWKEASELNGLSLIKYQHFVFRTQGTLLTKCSILSSMCLYMSLCIVYCVL